MHNHISSGFTLQQQIKLPTSTVGDFPHSFQGFIPRFCEEGEPSSHSGSRSALL